MKPTHSRAGKFNKVQTSRSIDISHGGPSNFKKFSSSSLVSILRSFSFTLMTILLCCSHRENKWIYGEREISQKNGKSPWKWSFLHYSPSRPKYGSLSLSTLRAIFVRSRDPHRLVSINRVTYEIAGVREGEQWTTSLKSCHPHVRNIVSLHLRSLWNHRRMYRHLANPRARSRFTDVRHCMLSHYHTYVIIIRQPQFISFFYILNYRRLSQLQYFFFHLFLYFSLLRAFF